MTTTGSKQLRHVFLITSGATPDTGNPDYWDGDIMWVTPEDINSLDSYWLRDSKRKITQAGYESCGTNLAPPKSIVLTKRAPIGKLAILAKDACSNQGCFLLTPWHETDTRFFYYWLSAKTEMLQMLGRGSTFMELSTDDLKSLHVPCMYLQQQRTIADYLNRETARLDGLVAEKERLLHLLEEKRRALITQVVMRGTRPHVSLRDSNLPWPSQVPLIWELTRLKFLTTEPLAYGANEAALDDNPNFPRFIRITDIDEKGNLREETFKSLPFEVAEPYLLRDGDVLLARSGATVGKAFIYNPSWGKACFAGYLIRCRCNTTLLDPKFFYFFTQTEPYWGQIKEGTIQATIQNFSAEKYSDLLLPVPPLKEQQAIVDYIQTETTKLDGVRSAAEKTIDLLKERRVAIIAAAVTGQLKISEAT